MNNGNLEIKKLRERMANKWFAAVMGLVFPPLAFVYLGRWWWVALLILVSACSMVVDLFLLSLIGFTVCGLIVSISTAIYAYHLAKATESPDTRPWYRTWWGTLSIPVTILSLIFLVRSFVVEPFSIPTDSMSPTLVAGDYIWVKKWGYGLYGTYGLTLVNSDVEKRSKPLRGEIFLLNPPHMSQPIVARIIGLPGDMIELKKKKLMINGVEVQTEKLKHRQVKEALGDYVVTVSYLNGRNPLGTGKWEVPAGHYFVMGDNRDYSADSRLWGAVPAENMIGPVVAIW